MLTPDYTAKRLEFAVGVPNPGIDSSNDENHNETVLKPLWYFEMATVTFKNIPDDLYEKLKQAAAAHHRSVNSELIYCLEKTLRPTRISAAELAEKAAVLRNRVAVERLDADEIQDARQQGRT